MSHASGRYALLLLLLVGCGTETYTSRLSETAQYFSYKEKLNQELNPPWSAMGVSWQPPKPFVNIPAPTPPAASEGEGEPAALDPADDPRQPHYLGITLPGLLGAWEADVQAEVGGQDEPRKAYLYLLSNHERYLQEPNAAGFVEDPQTYREDLENLLTGTIGVVLPPGETGNGVEKNHRYGESAPRVEPNVKFTPRKDFIAVTLQPQIDVGDLDLPFDMQLYEWTGRQIQLAVLMIYPQSISPREHLQERLLLSLETLSVDDQAPTATAGTGAAATAGPRPSGF